MSELIKNQITIHFDGPIATGHSVQLRTFSKSLDNLQNAIDRAYLDVKYGTIWKNARLKDEDYPYTDFLVMQTREGGFITDLLGGIGGEKVVNRIYQALGPAYERATMEAEQEHEKLVDLAEKRRKNFLAGAQKATNFNTLIENPDKKQTTAYGDRSIVKEFDQIASTIRSRNGDGSVIELDLYAGKPLPRIIFDEKTAKAFHNVVSFRTLGDPVEIPITLRALDSGHGISKAKAYNLISKKEFNLHIHTDRGFSTLRKYLKKRNPPPFSIIACPVLEYGSFDPLAGDMYFIAEI